MSSKTIPTHPSGSACAPKAALKLSVVLPRAARGVLSALVALLLAGAGTGDVQADRGVGVNLGRIEVEDRLSPGGGYNLPTLGVINTGDEAGEYAVAISYLQGQEQRRPSEDWFSFEPQRFFLEAGAVQNVRMRLTLPTGADPGDYFAFIEAHPVTDSTGVSIGVAAATRVSFSVKPANWLQAQRVRFNRFIDDTEPWSYALPAVALAFAGIFTLRRFVRIRLNVERR